MISFFLLRPLRNLIQYYRPTLVQNIGIILDELNGCGLFGRRLSSAGGSRCSVVVVSCSLTFNRNWPFQVRAKTVTEISGGEEGTSPRGIVSTERRGFTFPTCVHRTSFPCVALYPCYTRRAVRFCFLPNAITKIESQQCFAGQSERGTNTMNSERQAPKNGKHYSLYLLTLSVLTESRHLAYWMDGNGLTCTRPGAMSFVRP